MPRKYSKSKKSFRRGRKSRSTFSYYKKRSAKAQAYQISKLDKRINAVYKNLGGEVVRINAPTVGGHTWPDSMAVASPSANTFVPITLTPQGQTPSEIMYRGCYCNIDIGFKYPVVSYSATSSTTPTIWYRFLLVQYYQAGESYSIQDFLGNITVQSGIFDPLLEDVGTKARILKDIRVSIDQTHPERHLKLSVKRHFRIKQASGVSIQKNYVQLFVLTYNQGADTNNISSYGTQCAAICTVKPWNYIIYDKQ